VVGTYVVAERARVVQHASGDGLDRIIGDGGVAHGQVGFLVFEAVKHFGEALTVLCYAVIWSVTEGHAFPS